MRDGNFLLWLENSEHMHLVYILQFPSPLVAAVANVGDHEVLAGPNVHFVAHLATIWQQKKKPREDKYERSKLRHEKKENVNSGTSQRQELL